jgi:hypothetical protein
MCELVSAQLAADVIVTHGWTALFTFPGRTDLYGLIIDCRDDLA